MLAKLKSLIWPVTRAKLHRLVTVVGVGFAVVSVILVWAGQLGLSTEGKIGATIGMLTTLAAGWQRVRPKLDAGIDALPIPDGDATAPVSATYVQAAPLPSPTPTPVTVPLRVVPKDKGSVVTDINVDVALFGLVVCILVFILL